MQNPNKELRELDLKKKKKNVNTFVMSVESERKKNPQRYL